MCEMVRFSLVQYGYLYLPIVMMKTINDRVVMGCAVSCTKQFHFNMSAKTG